MRNSATWAYSADDSRRRRYDPLRYLVETGYEYLLPQIFSNVLIPGMVAEELLHAHTPASARQWADSLPPWIEVRKIDRPPFAHEAEGLDRGEWEAIELAKELDAGLLLMDERQVPDLRASTALS